MPSRGFPPRPRTLCSRTGGGRSGGGRPGGVRGGRARGGSGRLPVPGDTAEWEGTGTVPFSENPKVWNPPEGYVAAANFPPAGNSYGHYLSRLYEPPDRGKRILGMPAGGGKFSVEKFGRT